jgi:hypothetical protein
MPDAAARGRAAAICTSTSARSGEPRTAWLQGRPGVLIFMI